MNLRVSLLAVALAAVLPVAAEAAGLGKLTVLSALGQPLRAELDISASKEEMNSLAVRVAGPDAFRQANIEYSGTLNGVRFTLDRRSGGQPYFRLSSDRAISDPFLDMLIELSWSSGRLVREYTFLLDPPELKAAEAPVISTVAAPSVKPETEQAVAVVSERPASQVRAASKKSVDMPVPAKAISEGGTRVVQKGDTLAKIAATTKPEGVSLDQMLVALFRSNQDVFDGGNMNRLRAGKILSVPEKEAIAAVEVGEARKVIIAQAADFEIYKRKLAGAAASAAPAKEAAPSQSATGKITPKIEEKVLVPVGKDKLEVSRTEAGKTAVSNKTAEDLVAKDKALKEAQTRIAQLEKNVADMRKLAEMKSQGGADLQKQDQPAVPEVKKIEPAVTAKPVEVEKPAEVPKTPEEPKADSPPKPPETVATLQPPSAPPPQAKKPAPPPTPAPEPDFMEENGLLVIGGGGVLALLLGYFGFRAWKRKKDVKSGAAVSVLSGGSVFSSAEGQSIDTGDIGAATDFGLSDKGQLDVEGVDPVREADTYMAYGRDAQAEEILLDALKKDPSQLAVHLKLLEIYAARKSLPQFNTVAVDLHAQTGGSGADWERAEALGRALDPTNPLYSRQQVVSTSPVAEAATPISDTVVPPMEMSAPQAAEPSHEELPGSLDFDLDLSAPAASTELPPEPAAESPVAPVEDTNVLDFDLDLGSASEAVAESVAAVEALQPVAETPSGGLDIDFDLAPDTSVPEAAAPALEPAAQTDDGNVISFDFDLGETPAVAEAAETAIKEDVSASALDFDFDLGESPATSPEAAAPALDLSSISLDLSEPAVDMVAAEAPATADAPAGNPEVTTKLELAQAYEEMGDKEGARELLQEVLSEGDAAQQALARDRLDKLS